MIRRKFVYVLAIVMVCCIAGGCGKSSNEAKVQEALSLDDEDMEDFDQEDIDELASIVDEFEDENNVEAETAIEETEPEYLQCFMDLMDNAPIIDSNFLNMQTEDELVAAYGKPDSTKNGWLLYTIPIKDKIEDVDITSPSKDLEVQMCCGSYTIYNNAEFGYRKEGEKYVPAENIEKFFEPATWNFSDDEVYTTGYYILKDDYDTQKELENITYEQLAELFGDSGSLIQFGKETCKIRWIIEPTFATDLEHSTLPAIDMKFNMYTGEYIENSLSSFRLVETNMKTTKKFALE